MKNKLLEGTGESNETLRPAMLADYVGQEKMKKNLSVYIKSAKIRGKPLDHMLFYGPPGLGKTTIARIIANELGCGFYSVTGPAIEKPGDLLSMLSKLNQGDVLFVDEIHRIPKYVEEALYPAMEDFAFDVTIGQGMESKTIHLDLPEFTMIGATTKAGSISPPLRDRFGSVSRLELYSPEELSKIVCRDAKILGIDICQEAAEDLGRRSRGTPRIAIRLLKRLADFAVVQGETDGKPLAITKELADRWLIELDVNQDGLDSGDIRLLLAIHDVFCCKPVGLETLSAFLSEDERTIEDVYEPYLMQSGFLMKTPQGRVLTDKGISYVKNLEREGM